MSSSLRSGDTLLRHPFVRQSGKKSRVLSNRSLGPGGNSRRTFATAAASSAAGCSSRSPTASASTTSTRTTRIRPNSERRRSPFWPHPMTRRHSPSVRSDSPSSSARMTRVRFQRTFETASTRIACDSAAKPNMRRSSRCIGTRRHPRMKRRQSGLYAHRRNRNWSTVPLRWC